MASLMHTYLLNGPFEVFGFLQHRESMEQYGLDFEQQYFSVERKRFFITHSPSQLISGHSYIMISIQACKRS